ncbi:unnamed protein product [marine sediment metagenome]|uniref:Uncharacterized protein n=1 Tax=marine sediment metagenome TaxID=412755 RepID=X1GWH4_9ZZZZ
MDIPTKQTIIDLLQQACYLLQFTVDRSPDEDHALDELGEVLGHIKDIDAEGYPVKG